MSHHRSPADGLLGADPLTVTLPAADEVFYNLEAGDARTRADGQRRIAEDEIVIE